MPTDDIALLNQLRKDGEITEEQYEALRRHVLWGTPLPAHLEAELGESNPVLEAVVEPASAESSPSDLSGPDSPEAELPESLDVPEPVEPKPAPGSPRKFTPTLPSTRTGPAAGPVSQTPRPPAFSPQLRPRPASGSRTGPPPGQPIRPAGPPPPGPPAGSTQPRPYEAPFQHRPQTPLGPPPNAPRPATPPPNNLNVPLLAGGVVLVVLLAILGTWFFAFRGDGSVTPAKYASTVCPDLASWKGDIGKSADAMTAAVNSASDPRGKQKAAQNYFHAAGTRTDQLLTALGGDGTPKAGKTFADRLQSAARTAAAAFKSSAQQTGELETSASSFASGLQVIIHDPQEPVSQLQTVLAQAPGALESALKNESSCAALAQPAP